MISMKPPRKQNKTQKKTKPGKKQNKTKNKNK